MAGRAPWGARRPWPLQGHDLHVVAAPWARGQLAAAGRDFDAKAASTRVPRTPVSWQATVKCA